MTNDEFEAMLSVWGHAYRERSRPIEDRSPTGDSPLAHLVEFAPGKKVRRLDAAYRRANRAVRGGAPAWARDATHFTETRSHRPQGEPSHSGDVLAEKVERAVLGLHRVDDLLARVARAEYCMRGGQGDKAKSLEVSRLTYRERLAEARGWLRHALAA